MINHRLTRAWANGNSSLSQQTNIAGNAEFNLDEILANPVTNQLASVNIPKAAIQSLYIAASGTITLATNNAPVSAVITITMSGGPTGGTFTMTGTRPDTGASTTSGAIAYNATVAQMQTACDAVYGAGNTLVSGAGGTTWTVTFQGTCASYPVTLPTFNNTGLTGGTSPAASAATTTAGVRGANQWTIQPNTTIDWTINDAEPCPITADITGLYFTNKSGAQVTANVRILYNP